MRKQLKIVIPESLDEVTLGDYQKWAEVASESEGSLFMLHKTVEIFCNIPLLLVNKMSKKQLDVVANDILKTLQQPRKELVKRFKMNGVDYGFIPRLEDISAGEWIDLESYLKDWKHLDKALSILYRPIKIDLKDRWEIEEYDGVKDDKMKQMSASIALDAVFFLISLMRVLEKDLGRYLSKWANSQKDIQPQLKTFLTENGGGFTQSMPLPTMILLDWMLLPNNQLRRSLQCLSTKKKRQKSIKSS